MSALKTSASVTQEPLEDRIKRLPPFQAVFEAGGPPCSSALQLYLTDLDNKIEQNSRDIDSCLQGLVHFMNSLPGERVFSTPKDGLLYLYNSHVLEKDSCYDPETDEAVIILNALLRRFEEAGNEEQVLQDVLLLASSEGLLLPLRQSAQDALDPTVISSASMNAILDSGEQIIEQRWSKLTGCLKQYLTDQLLQLPVAQPTSLCSWGRGSNLCLDRRLELAESLRALCSDEDAWQKYRMVRSQQLENLMTKLMPEVEKEGLSHKDFAKNCGTLAECVMAMIDEDFVVLNSGIFRKVAGVFKALHELYLEKFSDEMSVLVDEISDEVAKVSKYPVKQSKSEQGLNKSSIVASAKSNVGTHRNSVAGINIAKDGALTPQTFQTHSLDSMFTTATATVAPEVVLPTASSKKHAFIPEDCMQSLLSIVLALMRLEDHIESLLRSVAWDVTGLPQKKARRKASIRGVLKSAASPETRRYSAHSLQYQQSGSFSSSDTQLDLLINNPHGDVAAAPKVVEHSRVEERFRWEWKLMFKKLAGELGHGIENVLQDVAQSALVAELQLWEDRHRIEVVRLDPALLGGKMDYPRATSLASHRFLEEVDRLLPLARVGLEGCLTVVRASFVDAVCIGLKNFHVQLLKMCKEIPRKAAIKQLYIIQATSIMIRNNLSHYENLLSSEESGKKPFVALLRQYGELADALMKQAVQLHSQAMATSVLVDADSSDWTNSKDFYEDEQCSFTVQMWNLYLRGLRHDLWNNSPPHMAQGIFSSVLQDSILALMQRYMRVQPSFRRIKQFRYDITAILLCTLDHLLWVCNTPSKLLDPGHGQLPHYSIHNLCSNLLAALAIVASPLEAVYKVFRKGHPSYEDGSLRYEDNAQGNNTQWLHFMWPALFPTRHKHYDDMSVNTALYLHLTLLLRQPQQCWGLLTQALIMKDCLLSIILLTNSLTEASKYDTDGEGLEMRDVKFEASSASASELFTAARQVVFAMVNILAHAHHFPSALSRCVLSIVQRCDKWDIFNVRTVSADLKPPLWMEALFNILDPLIEKILEPMLFFMLKEKSQTPSDSLMTRLQHLPCGCQSNATDSGPHSHRLAAKDVVRRCLELLIDSTQQNIYSLSRPIGILLRNLQAACTDRNIKTPSSCIAVQILAWAVWLKMKDVEAMRALVGVPLSNHYLQQLSMLADFYYQLMLFGKDLTVPLEVEAEEAHLELVNSEDEDDEVKGSGTPKLASKFHKTHKDWLPQKVGAITKYLLSEVFNEPENDILEGATSVFADQIVLQLAASIAATPTGQQDLQLVYCLIRQNSLWLLQQLDISPPLSKSPGTASNSQAEAAAARFQVRPNPEAKESFVPMTETRSMGICNFDQESLMAFKPDWTGILSSDLGLSEHVCLILLGNRHDMQPAAVLDDTEKRLVESLRSAFNMHT